MELQSMSKEQLLDMVAKLQAAQPAPRAISFKVTAKKADGSGTDGAISAYGVGRFPVTLYVGQWERLRDAMPAHRAEDFVNAPFDVAKTRPEEFIGLAVGHRICKRVAHHPVT